ncbi:heavy-metal-associated domain-containing protein [Micromonospora sp. NBC_01412]|uniref:heavy-metal-associated domain-containing protein n=1 Tax=Micromonospora sp. NBC_01412 TaxID=2903590 RepID=UPI00324A19E0
MCASCETGSAQTASAASESRQFSVAGMSCQPCATKVDTAVRAVAGVTDVRVDLSAGRITVAGNADENQIRAAVTDAGYRITTP